MLFDTITSRSACEAVPDDERFDAAALNGSQSPRILFICSLMWAASVGGRQKSLSPFCSPLRMLLNRFAVSEAPLK